MIIGVPKEIKPQESRIGLTPHSVKELIGCGHKVLIENNGWFEAGFDNSEYESAGAKIVQKAEDIFGEAELIIKVKEPLSKEVDMLNERHLLFTYLHLAAEPELTKGLINSNSSSVKAPDL